MNQIGFDKALFIAEKMKPEFAYNMAKLEGNTATYAQVETISHGRSVSGLSMSEIRQVDNIVKGWNLLIDELKQGDFTLSKQNAIYFNTVVAEGENRLNLGGFRDEPVAISGTEYVPPIHFDLPNHWDAMIESYNAIDNPVDQAIHLYGTMARTQFFGDGNKRTSLLMMNGCLISEGYCPITISPNRDSEYRDSLLKYYQDPIANKTQFFDFMKKEQLMVLKKWSYDVEIPSNDTEIGKTKPVDLTTKQAPKVSVTKVKENSGFER